MNLKGVKTSQAQKNLLSLMNHFAASFLVRPLWMTSSKEIARRVFIFKAASVFQRALSSVCFYMGDVHRLFSNVT